MLCKALQTHLFRCLLKFESKCCETPSCILIKCAVGSKQPDAFIVAEQKMYKGCFR